MSGRSSRVPRRSPAAATPPAADRLESRRLLAVITPFAPRFSVNDTGDVAVIANTLMTAPNSDANAANARAGTGSVLNNNNFTMTYVDVDSDVATFNSSRATLDLPAGAQVLAAYLYWGGRITSGPRGDVKFAATGGAGYVDLSGTVLGSNAAGDYHAFADVTAAVQAAGEGEYAVANVQAGANTADRYAGWSLAIAYRDPAAIPRNLTIFDGFAVVDAATPNVSITVSGFTTPPTGSVNARIGVVAYDGDRGSTGDSLTLNSTVLTDGLNPSNNFFNSTISNAGAHFTNKTPNYVNQLGFDADVIAADGILPNSATSATIHLTTGGEFYSPGVVTTSIELYAPDFTVNKTVTDVNGGQVEPGDVLEYAVAVTNNGGDASGQTVLTDPLPQFTSFVPGSLEVVNGANAGAKTDAAGDDQAEYDSALERMVFRIGAGANGSTGGSFAVTESSTIRFRVTIDPGVQQNSVVSSQAGMAFVGVTLGGSLTRLSNQTNTPVSPANDPPVNAVPAAQSTAEDAPLTFSAAGGNAIAVSDMDAGVAAGGTGSVRVALNATNGTVTLGSTGGLTFNDGTDGVGDAATTFTGLLADVNAALNGLVFTPTPDFSGTAALRILTDDLGNTGTGGAKTDADTVSIAVTPTADPPRAEDDSAATAEDTAVVVNVLANDTDGDGAGDLVASSVTIVAPPALGTVTVDSATGAVTYAPAANVSGADSFTYRVADAAGATDTAVVSITISAAPDAPVANDDATTTGADAAVVVDVAANDFDADGDLDPATVSLVTPPSHGSVVVDPSTGAVAYTPVAGYAGPDTFTYRISDAAGAFDTATVSLTVGSTNAPPVAAADSAVVTAGGSLRIDVLANDSDGDGAEDLVASSVVVLGGPVHGTAAVDPATGAITYTPRAGYSGPDSILYQVSDAAGATASATVTVTVSAPPPGGGAVDALGATVKYRGRKAAVHLPTAALAGATRVRIDWGDGTFGEVDVADLGANLRARHRYLGRSVQRHGRIMLTLLAADGSTIAQGHALTRNEQWVVEAYRRIRGTEIGAESLASLSRLLDRCRSLSATERKLERMMRRPAA